MLDAGWPGGNADGVRLVRARQCRGPGNAAGCRAGPEWLPWVSLCLSGQFGSSSSRGPARAG